MDDSGNKVFAVSFYSLDSNQLVTEIIKADNWRQAAIQHSETCFVAEDGSTGDINQIAELDVNEVREEAFNRDSGFDVVELFVNDEGDIDGIIHDRDDEKEEDDEYEPTNEPDEGDSYPSSEDSKIGFNNDDVQTAVDLENIAKDKDKPID